MIYFWQSYSKFSIESVIDKIFFCENICSSVLPCRTTKQISPHEIWIIELKKSSDPYRFVGGFWNYSQKKVTINLWNPLSWLKIYHTLCQKVVEFHYTMNQKKIHSHILIWKKSLTGYFVNYFLKFFVKRNFLKNQGIL